ncbi:hypothetical protein JTB14_019877 [Gonioctena quinquepunctata]|nr:hypothetical protein JTB14_019877 [Gonioctena quinquepunctata]
MDFDSASENDSDWDCENEVSDSGNCDTESDYSTTDEDEVMEGFKWTTVVKPFTDQFPKPVEEYHSEYEFNPAIDFEESKDAVVCFESFISPTIVDEICEWTNRPAEIYFEANNVQTVCGLKWKTLYVFFSLNLLTELVKCPQLSDYWSTDILCSGPRVFHKMVKSRNRFLSILKFIRFSLPDLVRQGAPLTRLGVFMARIRENGMNVVDVGPVFAIDEQLMLYKGRLHFRQYIKTKRSRFGIKLFLSVPVLLNCVDTRGIFVCI